MSAQPLKIIFAGTPEFAAESLKALLEGPDEVIAVYTQPDRPAGRGHKLKPSPVKEVALEADIPVYQPLNFKDEADRAELAALDADLMVVAAYGLILPKAVLDTPRLGCINVHASILPRWRGAAPIHRALLAGDQQTGITIMQMDVGLDTGDMLAKAYTDILDTDTSASLHDKLAQQGGSLLVDAVAQLKEGALTAEPQEDAQANYAHKLTKEEGKIDWSDTAENIARKVRGLFPWPSAYTFMDEQNIRIHQASVSDQTTSAEAGTVIGSDKQGIYVATGDGVVCLEKLQLPGKKAMTAEQILNGNKDLFAQKNTFA
ncbi:methionyl-tRNA formyltransferase [Litoribrevibacter albus]|uniref:Methionyl-tRNA formyltransferase n=1 Tax=Litoribrevibacter albus TaxID=1473156 RepID=A0AA37SD99_9GAMM|nr:methionyl-tRNA formyltransferase [Litoribrevibacter albus]GLQ32933.1 methionyl-tRNA formyltransferase [Litoribrevibacter albus]